MEFLMENLMQYGIFAGLFGWLLYYVLKTSEKREEKLNNIIENNQNIIINLTEKLNIVDDIKEDIEDIKKCIYIK